MPLDCGPDAKPCPKCGGILEEHYGYTPRPHHQLGSMLLCLLCGWFEDFKPDVGDKRKTS